MLLSSLYIKNSKGKGKGVFTSTAIVAGTIIEIAPIILLPEHDCALIDKSHLYNYYFLWGEEHKNYAICLGYGSLYNHSYEPNCIYETYYEEELIHFITLCDIEAEEELMINYNHDPADQKPVWFDK